MASSLRLCNRSLRKKGPCDIRDYSKYVKDCNPNAVCPRIKAYSELDYFGSIVSQCFFLVQVNPETGPVQQFSQYFDFTSVVWGKGCSFMDKMAFQTPIYNADLTPDSQIGTLTYAGYVIGYGLLRLILWQQIQGVFDVTILFQENNDKFTAAVAGSNFSCFLPVLNAPPFVGWNRGYKYSSEQDFKDDTCDGSEDN